MTPSQAPLHKKKTSYRASHSTLCPHEFSDYVGLSCALESSQPLWGACFNFLIRLNTSWKTALSTVPGPDTESSVCVRKHNFATTKQSTKQYSRSAHDLPHSLKFTQEPYSKGFYPLTVSLMCSISFPECPFGSLLFNNEEKCISWYVWRCISMSLRHLARSEGHFH